MGYNINLATISIGKYKEILESADLIPSQMILKGNIDDVFDRINQQNIGNVEELRKALGGKNKLQEFAGQSGISEGYLKILLRHVNGYRRNHNRIKDFPGLSESVVAKLEQLGIKNRLLTILHHSSVTVTCNG